MDRDEALGWLVANVTNWDDSSIVTIKEWSTALGSITLNEELCVVPRDSAPVRPITRADWVIECNRCLSWPTPLDATHHHRVTGEVYKYVDGQKFVFERGSWVKSVRPTDENILPIIGVPITTPRIAAHEFLERGVSHMRDRAVQRDSEAGERSMARAVAAFNAQEGTNLTEAQGWRFMIQLKYARAVNGVFVADDYEDLCSYGGLAGEAASAEAK